MADFENTAENQALVPTAAPANGADDSRDYVADFRAQAQDYGQRAMDAAGKAKTYAAEYGQQAFDKIKDLQSKDLSQIADEAKDFARRKPVETIAITAAVGLLVGLLLGRGGRR